MSKSLHEEIKVTLFGHLDGSVLCGHNVNHSTADLCSAVRGVLLPANMKRFG